MKRLIAVLVAVAIVLGIFPVMSFAAAATGTVEFYNGETNAVIREFNGENSIKAKISFEAPKTGSASVIAAQYGDKGVLLSTQEVGKITMVQGEAVDYTTPAVSVENAESVKFFVWDGLNSPVPVVKNPGVISKAESGSNSVEVENLNGVVGDSVSISGENMGADIPEGVLLENGATELTLSVESLENSASGIETAENEELTAIDIHIDGVAANNNVPIIVTVEGVAQNGLNNGNISLYHVENGETNEMTRVASADELTEHNTYAYDAEKGTLTLAMSSFSEVAVVADTVNAWNGDIDTSWYDANKTSFVIRNADDLAGFAQIVGGMGGHTRDSFAGKTVTLTANVNLGDKENANTGLIFHPIGYYYNGNSEAPSSTVYSFEGTFDGQGHTIANFYQNTWEIKGDYEGNYYCDAMGLFGYVVNGTIQNLNVDNFSSDGEFTPTGVIAAYAVDSTFKNIALTNCNPRVYNTGNGGIVGIGGNSDDPENYKLTFENITIDNTNKITALWGSWDVACGGLVGMFRGAGSVDMTNCHVAAQIDVYNDVCGNYQYYWYRYAGMMIGTNKNMTTDANGYTVPETDKFHAKDCTVHFGDWNNYWYCELVANSIASYTHDHQFSRLTRVDAVDTVNKTVTVNGVTTEIPDTGRYNYVVVTTPYSSENATCYHFVDGVVWNHEDAGEETVDVDGDGVKETVLKEDRQHYYLPFNQLFTGYGWGVKHIPVYNGENYAFEGITILDREVADSVEKFEKADTADDTYVEGEEITIGELFASTDSEVDIDVDNVQVTVSPADENSTASGTYVANTTDWTQGTLTFSGLGTAIITITDYYYCTPTTINITVEAPKPVDKFVAKENLNYKLEIGEMMVTKTLGEIFNEVEGVTIYSDGVTVTVEGATVSIDSSDWTESTVTFDGAGTYTLTITDNNICNTATAIYTITEPDPVEKFDVVFPNTDKYLYRVGNKTDVFVSSLFKDNENAKIDTDSVSITVTPIDETGVTATVSEASTWTDREINFDGTGVVSVTITDDNYCIPTVLYLEVVDAVNATSATSATSNNVVLLNDISGGFTVSKGYTLYGNGFKVTCSGDGSYRSKALSYGFITVSDGGILDNVQVICDIFPESYLYTGEMTADSSGRYPYAYSAVAVTENSTISNCYIYGARNNIFVGSGNVKIENTVTECGSLSNIHIKSSDAYTVTLEDVTTIQYQTTSSYDTSKTVLGFGVVVGDNESASNAKIKLVGDLKQYNWVTDSDKSVSNTYARTAITEALKVTTYQHTIEGKTAVNMGIAYLNAQTATIADERDNKDSIPYKSNKITMSGQTGQVYSISGSSITADARYDAETDGVIPYTPETIRNITANVVFNGTSDALTFTSGYDATEECWISKLTVDLDNIDGGSYDFKFANLKVQKYGLDLTFVVKDAEGNTVDKNTAITLNELSTKEYTLEITDSLIYNAAGEVTAPATYTRPFILNAKKTSIDPPKFTNEGTATAIRLVESKGGDWRPAYTVLTGVSTTYWNASESNVKTVDLSTLYNSGTISGNVWTYTCDDYTLTITGGAVHSDGSTITPVVANNTLYFASTNKAFGTGTTTRNIVLTYVFTDKNASNTWKRTETVTYSNLSEYDYNSFKDNGTLTEPSSGGSCVTPETLITLEDGSQKEVQYLTGEEELLVWNLETGAYDSAPIVFVDSDEEEEYTVVNLCFSDGSEVGVIYEHGFFDVGLGEYVYINATNANDFIGHSFVKQGNIKKNTWDIVTLDKVVIEEKVTRAYSPVTFEHLCYYTDGVLSMPGGIDGLFNIFEVDTDIMAYDKVKMAADIEKYGLFTYADFEGVVSETAYNAFNGDILKVAIGKGMLTWKDIEALAQRYMPLVQEK